MNLPEGPALSAARLAVEPYRGHALELERPFDSPDPSDLASVRRWVRSAPRPTAIDLFCGAGGLSLGLQDAGFSVLLGADSDPACVRTHIANLRGLGLVADLSDPTDVLSHLAGWGITTVDLVAGGVPCQPFSRAGQSKIRSLVHEGRRAADDGRAHLWTSFLQVVTTLRPAAVLVENVPDLASWDDGAVLIGLREELRELGYRTDARLLDAHRHGVPQHRSRLFLVGIRGRAAFEWPSPSPKNTVVDAIGDLPPVPGGQRLEELPYTSSPMTELQRRLRRGVASDLRGVIFDHITRAVRPDDAEAFALLRPGQTYADLPKRLQRYRSDIFTDKYKRLEWHELGRTITAHIAKDGYWYIHPEQNRSLSVREAARLQTFPDWYRFTGHPSNRFRQIGNAVPPLLAEALGSSIRNTLETPARRPGHHGSTQRFRELLLRWHRLAARVYPWREGASPWQVLMAEMCLHRTRADQVLPVYRRMLDLAPSPRALVENEATARDVLRSLGLRWRADNIIKVGCELIDRFGGEVPRTSLQLRSLSGVGDYGANATLCFAFGRRAVLLDTNTERIVSRVRGASVRRRMQMRMDLYDLAGRDGPDRAFNYALLDLGALVCHAGRPRCEACPVQSLCVTGSPASAVKGMLPPMMSDA